MNSCEKCGSLVPAEKAFCPNCGAAMIPERQRVPEDSGEMGETIYDGPPPTKPPTPKPTPPPAVKQPQASPAPARANSTPGPNAVRVKNIPKAAPVNATTDDDNGGLRKVLGIAAALFALSILVVAILYVMGKI